VACGERVIAIIFWKKNLKTMLKPRMDLHNDDFGLYYDASHEHEHWHKDIGYHSHEHIHQIRKSPSLKSMTGLAFILGFAHEEEFVILAIVAGSGGNPLTIMIAYACAVAIALIRITLLSLKVYQFFQHKIIYYSKYLKDYGNTNCGYGRRICSRIIIIKLLLFSRYIVSRNCYVKHLILIN
jgi:hypothetical protein